MNGVSFDPHQRFFLFPNVEPLKIELPQDHSTEISSLYTLNKAEKKRLTESLFSQFFHMVWNCGI